MASDQNPPGTAGRDGGRSNRGFASMNEEKQREIASKGGQSVPDEKRSFSQDRELAAQAGRKGGQSVPDEKRSFSQDRRLAAEAGRKGGEARGRARAASNSAPRTVPNGTGTNEGRTGE
jgi:general stress protein YciG